MSGKRVVPTYDWYGKQNGTATLTGGPPTQADEFAALQRISLAHVEEYETEFGKPRATRHADPCVVYVVRCHDFAKIGKAVDFKRRLLSIQTQNPFDVQEVAVLTSPNGHLLERSLHRRFSQYKHRGEWFRIEGALAEWVASGCPL